MAIAITDFEALCGFVPHPELTEALKSVPELRELIGEVRVSPCPPVLMTVEPLRARLPVLVLVVLKHLAPGSQCL